MVVRGVFPPRSGRPGRRTRRIPGFKADVGRARGAGTPKRRFRRKLNSEPWALGRRIKSRSSPTGC